MRNVNIFCKQIHFTVIEISFVLARPFVLRGNLYFLDFRRTKNNTRNLRDALIFNSQKCDINIGLKCEIMRKYELTDIQQRGTWWQKDIIPALPIAGQNYRIILTDIRKLLKFVVYIFRDFSRNPSRYSAKLLL